MTSTENIVDPFAKERVDKQTIWERKLLNLTLGNPLLDVKPGKSYIQIVTGDLEKLEELLLGRDSLTVNEKPILPEECEADFEKDCENARHRSLRSGDLYYDSISADLGERKLCTYLKKDPLMDSLKTIYRKARVSAELGANTLFLAVGALKWFDVDDKEKAHYAPLLLFPVELVRRSATSGYTLRGVEDGETMFNITLLQKLRQVYQMEIPWLSPLPRKDSMVDIHRVLDIMRESIRGYDGWAVEDTAMLGNFDYDKFMMWNDIHNNATVLKENPVVGSLLSGVVDRRVNGEVSAGEDLDEAVSPGEILLPISADSSQLEAIKAAIEGKSFILHGPPGTGKSQTITNIIANALYRGKKVLFVAEKKAALDVVQKRLDEIGLTPFCLALDSASPRKTAVMDRFKQTLNLQNGVSLNQFASEAERIARLRAEIKGYMDALHRQYPLGVSLYDCLSRYYSYRDESAQNLEEEGDRDFIPSRDWLLALRPEDKSRLDDLLSQYITACSICGNTSSFSHPLSEVKAVKAGADEIAAALDALGAEAEETVKALNKSLKVLLGEDEDSLTKSQTLSFRDLAGTLTQADCLTRKLLSLDEDALKGLGKTINCGRRREDIASQILGNYSRRVFELDPEALRREYEEAMEKGTIGRYFSLRALRRKLSIHSASAKKVPSERLSSDIELLEEYASRTASLRPVDFKAVFDEEWTENVPYDWARAERGIATARAIDNELISIYGRDRETVLSRKEKIREVLRDGLQSFKQYDGHCLGEFIARYDALLGGIEGLHSLMEAEFPEEGIALVGEDGAEHRRGWISSAAASIRRWRVNLGGLRDWKAYLKAREALEREGIGALAKDIEKGKTRPEDALNSLWRGIYKTYADYIVSQEESLSEFHGLMFEEKTERFRELCSKFETLTREELVNKLILGLPDLHKEASESPSVSTLLKNISNHCRGISLRTLFDLIKDILPRIFPCMMMSPLSVATLLNAEGEKFDLVIFDEASQIPTCEAAGAIARGKAVIVAGDPNQMPPTRFFQADTFDEDNAIIEDLESILDDSLALSLPSICLRWHYRSRHESLIAFSNSMYYDNSLLTFPSPYDLKSKVEWQYVPDGIYEKGGKRQNEKEARAVVDEIRERLLDPERKGESIGVITFNIRQQSLIEDLLDALYRSNPALEKVAAECEEPIFVKNLENVQGDERDVILFSVGYGPDKKGNVSLNFGPLNRDGGWRRLNVAVSRARKEMKVFSTLRAEQISVTESSSEGVKGLRKFLEYAERGISAIWDPEVHRREDPCSLTDEIARRINAQLQYCADTNVGSSGYRIDIGIYDPKTPDKYLLGIICDGYNSRKIRTVRDREIIQSSVLGSLGWNIIHVWTMDWLNNPDKVLSDIKAKLSEIDLLRDPERSEA